MNCVDSASPRRQNHDTTFVWRRFSVDGRSHVHCGRRRDSKLLRNYKSLLCRERQKSVENETERGQWAEEATRLGAQASLPACSSVRSGTSLLTELHAGKDACAPRVFHSTQMATIGS